MVKFECQRCMKCCTRRIVAINAADLRSIWKHLGGSPFDYVNFRDDAHIGGRRVVGKEYTGVLTLKWKENGDCIFKDGNKCSIYEARPQTCRLYPFDPLVSVNPLNPKDMKITKRYAKECIGLGKGKKYRVDKVMKQWIKDRIEHDSLAIGWPGTLNEFIARCVGAKLKDA